MGNKHDVVVLLACQADIELDARQPHGMTALYVACTIGNIRCAQAMFAAGARSDLGPGDRPSAWQAVPAAAEPLRRWMQLLLPLPLVHRALCFQNTDILRAVIRRGCITGIFDESMIDVVAPSDSSAVAMIKRTLAPWSPSSHGCEQVVPRCITTRLLWLFTLKQRVERSEPRLMVPVEVWLSLASHVHAESLSHLSGPSEDVFAMR